MNRLYFVAAILLIIGCAPESTKKPESKFFKTANGPVTFEYPADWYENKEEHPFDLQCFSKHQRMNTGVFLFLRKDLAENVTPRQLFELQIEDIRSKRKNFKLLEKEHVVQREGKTLTTVAYSGEKDLSRCYYKFTLVEFTDNLELIPVLLQISIPSYWNKSKPVLEKIAESACISTQTSQEQRE